MLLSLSSRSAISQILGGGMTENAMSTTPTDTINTAGLKRSDPAVQFASQLRMGIDTFEKWDSSFLHVQRYNKAYASGLPVSDLGTVGSPQRILKYSPFIAEGFQTGFNPYAIQNKNPENFKFYKAAVPLSRFYYTQGANGVFLLDVLHTQNFSPTWNVTVDFSSVQNGEIYTGSNQNHLHRGTMLGSQFTGKNGKYSNQLILSWNRARRAENFGLRNDSLFFLPNDTVNVRKMGNYYPSTSTTSSFYGTHHHKLDQKYRLNSQHYIFLQNNWIKEKYAFSEKDQTPDTAVYGKQYTFQTGAFIDSVVWIQFNSAAGYGKEAKKDDRFPLAYRFSASYNRALYNTIYKTQADIQYYSGLHGQIAYNPYKVKALTIDAKTDVFVGGMMKGNYLIAGNAALRLNKHFQIAAAARSQRYNAPAYTLKYNGNYFQTENTFSPTFSNMLKGGIIAGFKHIHVQIFAESGTQNNFLYTNQNGQWAQGNKLNYANLTGNIQLKFGKFYWINQVMWQTHSQLTSIPVPALHVLSGLYFEGMTFKKAMLMRTGIDLMYSSGYTAYKYNPMTAIFYPGSTRSGNYPVADFYVSGEIKTVMLFLKMEHLNQYLTNVGFNNSYISAQSYPIEPLRFRFGFIWRFHN